MYPELFRIGEFAVTSFGVMLAVAALLALWVFGRELRRTSLPEDALNDAAVAVIGGMAGAKLLWAIEFSGSDSFANLLFSRGGLSWFGGFLGGVGSGLWMLRRHRVPLLPTVSAAAPALAIGHAVGRIGCFLVGDDYGRPSDLPWAVAFPEGLPPTLVRVHPTQLYEALALAGVAWLVFRWRRDGVADSAVVGRYLVLAGLTRFLIEFVRVNRQVLGVLTLAQVLALSVALIGVVMMALVRDGRPSTV